jgi:hypothetical protein
MNSGGSVFSGIVDKNTGTTVSGAGPDTQFLHIKGGGGVVLQKGETVLQKGARERMMQTTGIDPLKFNVGPSANIPRTLNSMSLMNTGGVIGLKNPKISAADYNALLAISTAEDFANPQGRADVAQSLYNRLFASKKYGLNFSPTDGTPSIKNFITGEGQFEPTKGNRSDWLSIKDRNSAAIALANYKKISLEKALAELSRTDKFLRDPKLQRNAQSHVGGRTFFLGQSQHENMKQGDVLRGSKHNFFTHWYAEGTPYAKERGNIAAPIPDMLVPKAPQKPKPKQSSGFNFANLLGKPRAANAAPKNNKSKRAWYDLRNLFGMKNGGLFVNSQLPSLSGILDNVDVHPVMLKGGEYVLPSSTVSKLGLPLLDTIVAKTDRNSDAAKLRGNPPLENIMPPNHMGPSIFQVMNLPPVAAGGSKLSNTASSEVPAFSPISPQAAGNRSALTEIYGIA